jgi:glycosyltransferase involved in cell wall biosynthesis
MMHIFINALAASAGGGLTYIRNVLPEIAGVRDLRATVALTPGLRSEFGDLPNISFLEMEVPVARRFWYEQSKLPGAIERCCANVLVSTGNFALRSSPVPQILLSRNSVYTSADYYRDLLARGEYRMWMQTRLRSVLARKSIYWADVTVAPSEAFAAELREWTGRQILGVHHGFNHDSFIRNSRPLPAPIAQALSTLDDEVKLLFVSHYNYYRNFETLIRALPLLRNRVPERKLKVLLTCRLEKGKTPGAYDPVPCAKLIRELGVAEMVLELGEVPYHHLHQLYSAADLYITPAYTETFAHPLVEAMACGVPVVASDLPVHREICGPAAVYFPKFSPEALSESIANLIRSAESRAVMEGSGKKRAHDFSWNKHVQAILGIASSLQEVINR